MKRKIKKVVMQGVNMKMLLFVLIQMMVHIGLAQELKPTYNKGGYTIEFKEKIKSNKADSSNICGQVFNVATNEKIVSAKIEIPCLSTSSNIEGEYYLYLKPSNSTFSNFIKVTAVGYQTVETDFFKTDSSDIEVNFYLSEDDRPLIQCVETINNLENKRK
jgi:hypothetical protein